MHDGVYEYFSYALLIECMYGNHIEQSMDQPGMVVNPSCGQLIRENDISRPVSVRA